MRAIAVALVGVALLAGCGGKSQPAGSIPVTMNEFKFSPSTIPATHGTVVFWLINAGTTGHDLVIRDSNKTRISGSDVISAGDSNSFTVTNLAAGTYTIYCDQAGHEASGMVGTLTVT